ncbi:hypothetical protein NDU88_005005 [Pleurodeles waltl]|uniref:Uncharacterized protein n=1 Tax=Pleurodeles waltl TaxID=8319 RepID=A0AAV7UGS1_PLEWA|nr:hypothetical protein NDU88_005005 [Pleurodeles waltl]
MVHFWLRRLGYFTLLEVRVRRVNSTEGVLPSLLSSSDLLAAKKAPKIKLDLLVLPALVRSLYELDVTATSSSFGTLVLLAASVTGEFDRLEAIMIHVRHNDSFCLAYDPLPGTADSVLPCHGQEPGKGGKC